MALVEGIGDEVLIGAGILFIFFLIIVAWLSTNIQDIPFINVLIIELRHRNGHANNQTEANIRNDASAQSNTSTGSSNSAQPENARQENLNPELSDSVENSLPRKQGSDLSVDESSNVSTLPGSTASNDTAISSSDANNVAENIPIQSEGYGSNESVKDDIVTEISNSNLNNTVSVTETSSSNPVETCVTETSGSSQQETLTGNELRKRRLAFFGHKSCDDRTDLAQDSSTSESQTLPQTETHCVSHNIVQQSDLLQGQTDKSVAREDVQSESFDGVSEIQTQSFSDTAESIKAEVEVEGQQIRVRLKYLNDTQRQVVASPSDTIGHFRRTHFASELDENKLIRFIFNGQDLRNDTLTLQAYNIVDNSVIHCLITQATRTPQQPTGDHHREFDIGVLMFPLFAVILGIIWYLRFTYRQYFNATSTLSLVGISFLFAMVFVGSWNRAPPEHLD